jgi:NAD(P)-dependent dehydrogenase (short-subunit alcohol dehydrogenase family)
MMQNVRRAKMRQFKGKTAVITGAGSGIGEAVAHRLGAAGMSVVVADVDQDAADRVCRDLQAMGIPALAVHTDVSSQDSLDRLADAAWSAFGSVDLLCNNAGVVPAGRFRPVWDYPLEDWQWALDVNLMGVVHGLRAFVPRMLAQGTEGHIVTTASVAGLVSGSGSAVYSTGKHAAVRVTEALYASLAEMDAPIGVTLLCPGLVNTAIYRSERNRPEGLVPAAGIAEETPELQAVADNLYVNAISPQAVAEQLFEAICENRFYVLTSDQFDAAIRTRAEFLLERRNPRFENLLTLTRADVRS